ncbi:hypothetical protein IAR55_004733 [Kwoniella newhampshirensis]|uniref:N-acetyltransferase domain-containing protein n=1 Tax=Kwoniella newhampshirensis TaxID=1651941 RepID=A0AAW0YW66_9TREE
MSSYTYSIRDADPSEDSEIALLFYNNFLKTWNHNWWASAKTPPGPLTPTSKPNSQLQFKRALVAGVRLTKDHRIRVIVAKSTTPTPASTTRNDTPSSSSSDSSPPPRPVSARAPKAGGQEEIIVGAAMWFPPHVRFPSDPITIYRAGFVSIMRQWGWRGYKRLELVWGPTLHSLQKKGFARISRSASGALSVDSGSGSATGKNQKMVPDDAAYLQMIAVDSLYRGKGLGGRLLRDGEDVYRSWSTPPPPIMLEATEHGPKQVYLKGGYEVIGETKMAKGEVDEDGCVGQGKERMKEGGDVWVMCKWTY